MESKRMYDLAITIASLGLLVLGFISRKFFIGALGGFEVFLTTNVTLLLLARFFSGSYNFYNSKLFYANMALLILLFALVGLNIPDYTITMAQDKIEVDLNIDTPIIARVDRSYKSTIDLSNSPNYFLKKAYIIKVNIEDQEGNIGEVFYNFIPTNGEYRETYFTGY